MLHYKTFAYTYKYNRQKNSKDNSKATPMCSVSEDVFRCRLEDAVGGLLQYFQKSRNVEKNGVRRKDSLKQTTL